MSPITFRDVENLRVDNLLCDLHIEIWEETKRWPRSERFELTSQVLRSSNSSPAQLAEKNEERYQECIRMLNGLEKTLESSLPEKDRKWVRESREFYSAEIPAGYPDH